ncbi:MAG: hypothetical protein WCQ94_09110 [Lachnospiraceae bacterium]
MTTQYTEIPHNWNEVRNLVETDFRRIVSIITGSGKLFFYDTCSFIKHANLHDDEVGFFVDYYKKQDVHIVVTRCVIMELASLSGNLNKEYVRFFGRLKSAGLETIVLNEENLFDILSVCFSNNKTVNSYLSWSVRMMQNPVSTITETLKRDDLLYDELISGAKLDASDIYRRFFASVRGRKEASDNLGEELIGICTHVLSHLPGVKDGKLCVVTEDKEAAAKIGSLINRTNKQYRGARIVIYSTPKLTQCMYHDHMELSEQNIVRILSHGSNANITVIGTTIYDLAVNDKISMTCEELARKIMEPNGINIVF